MADTLTLMREAVAKRRFGWADVIDDLIANGLDDATAREWVAEIIENRNCRVGLAMAIVRLIVKEDGPSYARKAG